MLSLNDMTALMTQIHLVDGYLNTLPSDSAQRVIEPLYAQEYSKFELDSTSFKANVAYFLGNPDQAKLMYEQIQKNFTDLDKVYMREDSLRFAHSNDSINRVAHFHKLRDDMHKLILEKQDSSLSLNYSSYGRIFLRKIRLPEQLIIQANPEVVIPVVKDSVALDSTSKAAEIAKNIKAQKLKVDSAKIVESPVGPANRVKPRLKKIN